MRQSIMGPVIPLSLRAIHDRRIDGIPSAKADGEIDIGRGKKQKEHVGNT